MQEFPLVFRNWSKPIDLHWRMHQYVEKETKKELKISKKNVFDVSMLHYVNEYGIIVACEQDAGNYISSICVFEVRHPSELNQELLKSCITYFHDDRLMGRGVVCDLEKNKYIVQGMEEQIHFPKNRIELQTLQHLLHQVEIRQVEHELPKCTRKGIEFLKQFHQTICSKEEQDWPCECPRMIDKCKEKPQHSCPIINVFINKYQNHQQINEMD